MREQGGRRLPAPKPPCYEGDLPHCTAGPQNTHKTSGASCRYCITGSLSCLRRPSTWSGVTALSLVSDVRTYTSSDVLGSYYVVLPLEEWAVAVDANAAW